MKDERKDLRLLLVCSAFVCGVFAAIAVCAALRPTRTTHWIEISRTHKVVLQVEEAVYTDARQECFLRYRIINSGSSPLLLDIGKNRPSFDVYDWTVYEGKGFPPRNGLRQIALGLTYTANPSAAMESACASGLLPLVKPGATVEKFMPITRAKFPQIQQSYSNWGLLSRSKALFARKDALHLNMRINSLRTFPAKNCRKGLYMWGNVVSFRFPLQWKPLPPTSD